jgi:ribulose-phosphate 3-epimerase
MKLGETLKLFEKNQIEYIHVDIMDGEFVPNYTLGTDFCKMLKQNTTIPLDIHLMINDPERKMDWFVFGEGDYVSVHFEATAHLHRALAAIRARGAKALVAINPSTPISSLDSVLDDVDGVLIMTVNPGFAGQKLVESTIRKIQKLRTWLDAEGYSHLEIQVDGNVSFENAKRMSEAGADIFVAGSSSVFAKGATLAENTEKLRDLIEL